MKDLPKVFAADINKELSNNASYSYNENNDDRIIETIDVRKKIKDIFNSPKYVYKMEVELKLKTGTVHKKIIGFNRDYLLTFDNDTISIDSIIDINFI